MIRGRCSRASIITVVCSLCLTFAAVCFCEHAAACHNTRVPPVPMRDDFAALLQLNKFTTGAELGVQKGEFALHNLQKWDSCEEYILVDLWKAQDNYADVANKGDDEQTLIMKEAQANLAGFSMKTKFKQMKTVDAAAEVEDESLDFIYVDARHDECGVAEDLATWWPKLRKGGIFAGHDYYSNAEMQAVTPFQDWAICADGSRKEGAVKGAVNKFASHHNLLIARTEGYFPSWWTVKPCTSHVISKVEILDYHHGVQ